jgi:hypothetical protein
MGNVVITAAKTPGVSADGRRTIEIVILGSSSYATGGDSFGLSVLGLRRVTGLEILGNTSVAGTVPPATPGGYDLRLGGTDTAPKILVYDSTGNEIANATSWAAKQFAVRFLGYQ